MVRHAFRIGKWFVVAFIGLNVFLALITNVPTHITDSDDTVFQYVLNLKKPYVKLTYAEEIALILFVQAQVIDRVPYGTPIPEYENREPKDLFKNLTGECYDRSRTFDKVFSWLGFEVRHVYILYPEAPDSGERLPFWRAFFTRGTMSHAVTEVKTSRGWVTVDSNSKWLSVTTDGSPIQVDRIYENAGLFSEIPNYFNQPYWAIRGMYSRRGQFYRPYIPYPQLNWFDFFSAIYSR